MNFKTLTTTVGILGALVAAALPHVSAAQGLTYDSLISQSMSGHAAMVINQVTGDELYSSRANEQWVPASLTKLVTAQVVLDSHPDYNKLCDLNASHNVGGARLYTAASSVKYRLGDLFSASLVASANNATNALADCTGMARTDFVAKMNAKAVQLGATHSKFVDPAGISEFNYTTASDMAKIANAAFSTAAIRDLARPYKLTICAKSGPAKCHYLTNTNQLLTDPTLKVLIGKTGYLDESKYNFAGSFLNAKGQYVVTVVLGSPNKKASFDDTKKLAQLGWAKYAQKESKPLVVRTFKPGQKVGIKIPLALLR